MTSAPLEIPGYRYDPEKRRYFKIDRRHAQSRPEAQPQYPKRSQHKRPRPNHSNPSLQYKHREHKKHKIGSEKRQKQGKISSTCTTLDSVSCVHAHQPELSRLKHQLVCSSFQNFRQLGTQCIESLTIGENITSLCWDEHNPNIVKIGTTLGNIIRTYKNGPSSPSMTASDRIEYSLGSAITSMKSCGSRFLITSIGSPAKAIIGTSESSISLESVQLSPRNTSIWTSSLSDNRILLGCDQKVLYSGDLSRTEMLSFYTGSPAYAIEQSHDKPHTFLAGLRSGRVFRYDFRDPASVSPNKNSALLRGPGNITNLRIVDDWKILAAGTADFLALYDERFIKFKPLLAFPSHSNQFMTYLGLDVYRSDLVAAAGQDCQVRLWSLKTGNLLGKMKPPSESEPMLFHSKQFDEPVPSMLFDQADDYTNINSEINSPYIKAPALYLSNGIFVERYSNVSSVKSY